MLRSRAPETCGDRALNLGSSGDKSWGDRALVFWWHSSLVWGMEVVAGEEAGRDVSPAAVEAWKVGFRAASSHGNSCLKRQLDLETEQMI